MRWVESPRPPPRSGGVSADGKAQKSSFYKRPSKAIEMGGGFFIPGLEGYKLRLATALLVLLLLALNRYPGYTPAASQLTSEAIGAGAAVILLAQALIEKLITEAGVAQQEEEDNGGLKPKIGGRSGRTGGMEEEYLGPGPGSAMEDDVRWVGYALDENLNCPAVALLDSERGLLYYRRRRRISSPFPPSSSLLKELALALAQALPAQSRRAVGMSDALASLGGAGGTTGMGLAQVLGMSQVEGAVVVRVGPRAVLAVAPPAGGIMRDQAVWVERAAALLEASGLGEG